MSEYIDREAAKKNFNRGHTVQSLCERGATTLGDVFALILDEVPAADVREVVLCKDCRHRDPEDHKCDSGGMERQGCPFEVKDDYFCAYGELREQTPPREEQT